MVKYFHELREEELKWLMAEGDTWDEVAADFPGPSWCSEQAIVVHSMGCWSLIMFENGHSRVTGKGFCKRCPLYRPPATEGRE